MIRQKWVDASKGITMIMIVLGHVLRFGDVRDIVYAFHVPYFFFLSGVTEKDELSIKRIRLEAERLLIPYYAFGFISIGIYILMGSLAASSLDVGHAASVWENIAKLLYGSSVLPFNAPLWFLPCLFITKLWYQIIRKCLKGNRISLICVAVLGALVGFVYTDFGYPVLPFSFDLMLKLFPFFLLGRLCSELLGSLEEVIYKKFNYLALGVLLLTLTAVLGKTAPSVNYTNHNFPNPFLFYIIALIGGGGVFFLSVCFRNIQWLAYLGKRTMQVLTMHKYPIVFFQVFGTFAEILSRPDSLESFVLGGIPVTAITIVMCLAVGYIIELYVPFLLGKRRARM